MEKFLDPNEIKFELNSCYEQTSLRGLQCTSKWLAELIFAIGQANNDKKLQKSDEKQKKENNIPIEKKNFCLKDMFTESEYDRYIMCKTFFDDQEYDRACHFSNMEDEYQFSHNPPNINSSPGSSVLSFLHLFSIYKSGEMKKADEEVVFSASMDPSLNDYIQILHRKLTSLEKNSSLDAYHLYIYGLVLSRLEMEKEAINKLCESVTKQPLLWCSWLQLSKLVANEQMLQSLDIPKSHWIYDFFLGEFYKDQQHNEKSLEIYKKLISSIFSKSTHLLSKRALVFHDLGEVDSALSSFVEVHQMDPYRLDYVDTYSNMLYVKEKKTELAYLAHHCSDVDKYRFETCCVIGNYYSLRNQHDKAVLYFQRAIQLNPAYLSAWTLIGHEYLELKSTSSAILAYRRALDVNKRDYRAWYGLGQTYEILKMPLYSLYYYKQAYLLRPNDSRMSVAMGEAYDSLGRLQEAKRCYWKAISLGDAEGLAIIKLAKLFERLAVRDKQMEDQAAGAYATYVNETLDVYKEDQGHAYRFLANYHLARKNLHEAFIAAHRCVDFPEVKEEGKALLRQITEMRGVKGVEETGTLATTTSITTTSAVSIATINTPLANSDVISVDNKNLSHQ